MKKYIILAVIGIAMAALGIYETLWCIISPHGSRPIIWLFVLFIGILICFNKNIKPIVKKFFQ